jgi:hypothetical protein
VMLLPRRVAHWLWDAAEQRGWDLGMWAPHVFGRMLGGRVTWKVHRLGK